MVFPENAPHVEYLGHHMLLLAIPAFLPAILVVAVVLYVALKDRRNRGTPPPADQRRDAAGDKRD